VNDGTTPELRTNTHIARSMQYSRVNEVLHLLKSQTHHVIQLSELHGIHRRRTSSRKITGRVRRTLLKREVPRMYVKGSSGLVPNNIDFIRCINPLPKQTDRHSNSPSNTSPERTKHPTELASLCSKCQPNPDFACTLRYGVKRSGRRCRMTPSTSRHPHCNSQLTSAKEVAQDCL